ncbi:MAG: Sec-independent protein translocase protein TatB [Alphaproteobacteria bacterium]|nr:Sec-independent protein translocase protein TatB [Alphaproteobacteria bacterium]
MIGFSRMLDIGWSEMALIALVVIVVIGPKDLPKVLRAVGQFTAKARSMAREFQNSLDDIAREAEVADLKQDISKLAQLDIREEIENKVDPEGELRKSIGGMSEVARDIEKSAEDALKPAADGAPAPAALPEAPATDIASADPERKVPPASQAGTTATGGGER